MSESENAFDAGNTGEESSFDFSSLVAENTDDGAGEFTPPVVETSKPRWWDKTPKNEKRKSRREEKKSRPMPAMPRGGLKSALENVYTGMGMALMPFDPSCGRIIIESAPKCAEALDDLAKTNPAVRRLLISLVTTSAWGAVIMAHAPILMAIAMHHIPSLRERQEKMVGEFAEMMANNFGQKEEDSE
jgi:hypothetical protein